MSAGALGVGVGKTRRAQRITLKATRPGADAPGLYCWGTCLDEQRGLRCIQALGRLADRPGNYDKVTDINVRSSTL